MKNLCLFLSLFLMIPGKIGAKNHSFTNHCPVPESSYEPGQWLAEAASASEEVICYADTVPGPKVEILGKMKIAELPVGTGVEVLADPEGNLFKRSGMNMMPTGNKDSITYTVISGFGPAIPTGTYDLLSFNIGGTQGVGSTPTWNITKKRDACSVGFMNILTTVPANNIQIEVNIYESGSTTPYFSHKFTNITVLSASISPYSILAETTAVTSQIESYALLANIYGLKDQITGTSFAWDYINMVQVPY
jgi:hypothetical protein